jgi:cytochrome c peroxidase
MRKFALLLIGFLFAGTIYLSCTQPVTPPEKLIAQKLLTQVDSFALLCKQLQTAASAGSPASASSSGVRGSLSSPGGQAAAGTARLQSLFLQARLAYKRFEWAAEYFDPSAARSVNGPPVREVERSGVVFQPSGLQLIETYLFPAVDSTKMRDLDHQVAILLAACQRYRSYFTNIDILAGQVFDAARLEVFRVMTLGITGFDNPLTLRSCAESAAALESLEGVLGHYPDPLASAGAPADAASTAAAAAKTTGDARNPAVSATTSTAAAPRSGDARSPAAAASDANLAGSTTAQGGPANASTGVASPASVAAAGQPGVTARITAAAQYLAAHPDFNHLDRAAFITGYANPLTAAISDQETALRIHIIRYNRLLNQDARTLFDSGAFNVNAYSPNPASFISPAKIALGQKLFSDASLSSTGTRSCQSCHQPGKAFTDGLVTNTVLGGTDKLPRNTPTLLNVALQPAQFYDMRVATLEDQARAVVQNNAEMHGSMKLSVRQLWQDSAYRRLFSSAFPRKDREGIDTLEVMNALSSYVRSLVALNSRFDDYMRGNASALSASEIDGFNLFMGKARCGTCHYMPIFNGAFPPRFVKVDAEIIGVPQTAAAKALDSDPGRYAIVPDPAYRHAFKTPSVRNAARTAPYMHNGVYTTLEQVVDFYDKGGGAGLGLKVDGQTLPFDRLGLSAQERSDLVAFIKCLDSR